MDPLITDQDLMKNQIQPLKCVKKAHQNSIQTVASQPNGKVFASGSHDKLIKIWDANNLKQTMTLSDHKQGVWTLDYSKNGNLLASGSPDKSILIWDSQKNAPGIRINWHKDKVYCVRFNENDKIVASCGDGGQLCLWDLANTKTPIKQVQLDTNVVYSNQWSNNGQFLFATGRGSKLYQLNSKTLQKISSETLIPNSEESRCQSCCTNYGVADGKVFCGTSRGSIARFSTVKGKLQKQAEWAAHMDGCRKVLLHKSKPILLSTGHDGSVRMWNQISDKHQAKITLNLVLHKQNVPAISFLGEDKVVTGGWDQELAIWDVQKYLI